MLIGNPYQFAVIVEIVKEWNQYDISPFYNGVLLICIDGKILPKRIGTATLGVDIPHFERTLSNIATHDDLFYMDKEKAFVEVYKTTFPNWKDIELGVDEDYRYYVSPQSLSDSDCIMFAVGNGEQVRIMAAQLKYIREESTHDLNNMDISETFITNDELKKMISELDKLLN